MRPAHDRPTPYVAGVAQDVDRLEAEVERAMSTGRVSLDGLLVQEVLGELRVGPIYEIRRQTCVPYEAGLAALKALVRAGLVEIEERVLHGGHRVKRVWHLVPGAKLPPVPEVRAEVAPERIAHVVPPKPANTRKDPEPREPHRFAEWRR